MLRINLLPAYIGEKKKTRAAIVGASLLVAAVTGGMLFAWNHQNQQVIEREAAASQKQTEAEAVTQLQTDATSIRGAIKPITVKRDFIDAALFYNKLRPRIYRRAARYTTNNVEFNSMNVTGQSLAISAFAKRTSDIGRFLITMFGNPDLSAVSVTGVPAWSGPGGTGGGGSGGASAFPGSGGGGSGGYGGGGGGGGYGGGGGRPGGAAAGGQGGGGGVLGGGQQPNRPGFPFSVAATLIYPVAPPNPPTAGGGGGAAGGFGGGGGYGGGFPGGGGGGYGGPSGPAGGKAAVAE